MTKKIAVINNKGGSAKTPTSINLAGAYAKRHPHKKVLIVETDGQGNATRSFNMKASSFENTMYDVFMNQSSPEECIANAFQNIDIIPANSDMNFVEFDVMNTLKSEMSKRVMDVFQNTKMPLTLANLEGVMQSQSNLTDSYFNMLAGKFDSLEGTYDLIIFDTPPEIKGVTSSVLAIADEAIIPFEPDTYSIDGIRNILTRIGTIKRDINPNLNIAGLLAVKVKGNTKLHIDTINGVMKFSNRMGLYYFQSEIPNSIRFASSTSYKGLPATITQQDNKFVMSYYNLLDELIERGVIDG